MSRCVAQTPRALKPVMAMFPVAPESVREARAFVRWTLAAWDLPDLKDDAQVIVSELAGNAVAAWLAEDADEDDRVRVDVSLDPDCLVIGVSDRSEKNIRIDQEPDAMDESGRGLLIARCLAEVGSDRSHGVKRVWARLPVNATKNRI